mgnify:CR=1 FL=1
MGQARPLLTLEDHELQLELAETIIAEGLSSRDAEELVKRISERAKLENRADDNPETVQKRLAVYEESTKPLIDYYRNSGLYQEIDGLQDVDTVFADITKALEK